MLAIKFTTLVNFAVIYVVNCDMWSIYVECKIAASACRWSKVWLKAASLLSRVISRDLFLTLSKVFSTCILWPLTCRDLAWSV